jgi:hypothetical protein
MDTSNVETIDFNQGVEPKDIVWPAAEYGDFSEALARITLEEQKVYLPFEDLPGEIVTAPVTSIVCFFFFLSAQIRQSSYCQCRLSSY